MEKDPVKVIPKEEEWLYDPANKEIVDLITERLKKKATIPLDEVRKKIRKIKTEKAS